MSLRSIESIFFDKANDYLKLSMPTFHTHQILVRKCEYLMSTLYKWLSSVYGVCTLRVRDNHCPLCIFANHKTKSTNI